MSGSMNLRLKSSSASRELPPNPAAPSRKFGPMNASQRSPLVPILRSQPRGRAARVGLKKIFHVTFYDVGEFFDGQGDHIQISLAGEVLDSKKQSKK